MSSKVFKTIVFALLGAVPFVTPALAATCGSGGSNFQTSDVQENLGDDTLAAASAQVFSQNSAQICIVNRAPQTAVSLQADQINTAIATVLEQCCGGESSCAGGQQQITATSGNVIDLSVQGTGDNCSHD